MQNTVLALLLILGGISCATDAEDSRPNILVINVDDLGWKDLGFMGSEFYETPHLDALSRQGMVFSQAYAAASNCAPSRASLMTGLWTPRHGILTVASSERGASKDRKLIPVVNKTSLAAQQEVLPAILQKSGYQTIHAGKWHITEDPTAFGFDQSIGGGPNGHPSSYYPPYGNVDISEGEQSYLTDLIVEKTLQVLDTVKSPFFLNYAPYAVHTPIQGKRELLPKYEAKEPSGGHDHAAYASMIENLDSRIGLLLAKLKERQLLANTFIVFTSDNGGVYGITNQYPLRAGKGSYYEGGIRVPFFCVWEGAITPGIRSSVPITQLDIFPTLLDLAGISNQRPLDGQSLLPVLLDTAKQQERPLFWHFPIYLEATRWGAGETRDSLFRTRPGSAIRLGKWKLHHYFEDQGIELYNLEEDIGERTNLATSHPEKAAELLQILQSWWKETGAEIPITPNPEFESAKN